ncbi:hypothetical protein GLOTRDRAFT_77787 [Gloeophyllum trabeum ATCC 11539]|uniref:Uncharacterized protein n=1 Tax=Gloeophyllum trabeum (strain ATCC 11539 / FP-39264 / Madison 617) TaxID=670483 RepID=S7Q360_GLOTA|nr:uncharacterized protein GLOTRDRAFT_77787 [Gloeophyllum trabeum ATCC 11539]EPQ53923.1 hypothetical protein GLOTRDRAFT_77787 [Gloeophyllum trabeum ATCC 11539]
MMRPTSLRAAARRIPRQSRGMASSPSTENAQKKAQEYLATAQKLGGQGFEAAQKYGQQGVETAKKMLGPAGEKASTLLGSYKQPLLYNLAVAREILKQVYVAERLQPPTSLSAITNAYSTLWARASNPAYWREVLRNGEWKRIGVYGLEAYGIFKIGEILGRRSLVGYDLH